MYLAEVGITVPVSLMGWWFGKRRDIEKKRKNINDLMQLPFMTYSCESVPVGFIYAQGLGYCLQWNYSAHAGQCRPSQIQNV